MSSQTQMCLTRAFRKIRYILFPSTLTDAGITRGSNCNRQKDVVQFITAAKSLIHDLNSRASKCDGTQKRARDEGTGERVETQQYLHEKQSFAKDWDCLVAKLFDRSGQTLTIRIPDTAFSLKKFEVFGTNEWSPRYVPSI
jgi:hypothetical protein